MTEIKKISSSAISKALETAFRQYLVGDLKQPQELGHIYDEDIEVGISFYKEFTADKPHFHTDVTEYQYMIQGSTRVKNLETDEVIKLEEGDFYVIKAGTPYAQKSMPNTKILFFKYPGMNDKRLVDVDEKTKEWLREME
ncbi:cupin domain-containing protein [Bacillus sp. V3]|nr:cupin domain-containing protein [Bacillus sp. V3]